MTRRANFSSCRIYTLLLISDFKDVEVSFSPWKLKKNTHTHKKKPGEVAWSIKWRDWCIRCEVCVYQILKQNTCTLACFSSMFLLSFPSAYIIHLRELNWTLKPAAYLSSSSDKTIDWYELESIFSLTCFPYYWTSRLRPVHEVLDCL